MTLYEHEASPRQLADIVVDDSGFARPRLVRETR